MATSTLVEGQIPIASGRKVVAATGVREQLTATKTPCKVVVITAETDNTGIVVFGSRAVVAAVLTRVGTPLYAGDSVTIPCRDLSDIWLDAMVNGDGITYTAFN